MVTDKTAKSIRTKAKVPNAPPSRQCTKRRISWRRGWKMFYRLFLKFALQTRVFTPKKFLLEEK